MEARLAELEQRATQGERQVETLRNELVALRRRAGFTPSAQYTRRVVAGVTLALAPDVVDHPALFDALAIITPQLRLLESAPPSLRQVLDKTTLWLEVESGGARCATYHPSAEWLRAHGFNPDKAESVEIASLETFIAWSKHQPAMILHELAHAVHHRLLTYDDVRIDAAFRAATASGKYADVRHHDGGQRRAYALTDAKEYFAEISEAYLSQNDAFPFVRAELRDYDPQGYELASRVWGELKPPCAEAAGCN